MTKAFVLLCACVACSTSAPMIESFTVSPAGLPVGGGAVTLTWNVESADTLTIDQSVGTVTPPSTGSKDGVNVATTTTFTLTATNGGGTATKTVTACVDTGTPSITLTGPTSYTCHQAFQAVFAVSNPTCTALTISGIDLTGTVIPGGSNCTPPPDSKYTSSLSTIAPNTSSVSILNLTGSKFCCFNQDCPATFSCDETYTATVTTSAGNLVATETPVHLDLDGCTEICP